MTTNEFSRILKTGATAAFALLLCVGVADFGVTAKKKRTTWKTETIQRAHKKRNSRDVSEQVSGRPATYIRIVDESKVKHEVRTQKEDYFDAEVYRPAAEIIYTTVEQQAQFPGGASAMMQWIEDNISCPERVKNSDKKVRVIVRIVIEKDGTVTNPAVVKGVDHELDKAAIDLMEKMPRWEPGKMNGVPVRSYYIIPVLFNRGK